MANCWKVTYIVETKYSIDKKQMEKGVACICVKTFIQYQEIRPMIVSGRHGATAEDWTYFKITTF